MGKGLRALSLIALAALVACSYSMKRKPMTPARFRTATKVTGSAWGYEPLFALRRAELDASGGDVDARYATVREDVNCYARLLKLILPLAALFPLCKATVERVALVPASSAEQPGSAAGGGYFVRQEQCSKSGCKPCPNWTKLHGCQGNSEYNCVRLPGSPPSCTGR